MSTISLEFKNSEHRTANLLVKVHGFTFRFSYISQLDRMIAKFFQKHRGGEQMVGYACLAGHGHYEAQTDFSKLPQWLKDKKHRPGVLKALQEARKDCKFISESPNQYIIGCFLE